MRFASILLATVFAGISSAQPTTAPAGKNEQIITRVYDISDMTWRKNDYPAMPNSAAMGAGDAPQSINRTDPAADICHLVQDTIAPESWKENGGQIGTLREIGGQLVVAQTVENQNLISGLFSDLRQGGGRMVVVRAYWLLLDPASVPASTRKADGGKELQTIDEALINANHLYCAAQTTCFNGQTVHVTSGRQRNVLTGLSPVVASNAVGYQPSYEKTQSGVVLQLTPHLEPESNDPRMVVDLQSNVTQLGDVSEKIQIPATTEPAYVAAAIDRLNEVTQSLQTTVRLPLGKKVLVGGMTLEPTKNGDAQQLYLVIEADAVK